ncbi:DUF1237 domain protein [Kockovaella imperatae]|uniref:DUF1237 domain protein n=1 Tax=Kockovaella imperatae TaxID=4999 RepID=A0A1Y1UNJ0_9TREE|nr:DUF1237 domain protein [Kockovaella imperatae]ORX39562.1 DUF1237 domain protein [Kockovaella imperatae]
MVNLSYQGAVNALISWLALVLPGDEEVAAVKYQAPSRVPASCPDYNDYSQTPHGPYSDGTLGLPSMRPEPECRTFHSEAMERVISDMRERLEDPDLAMLFENSFSQTIDTTVQYFDEEKNLAFIVTGDITAQWLRDTGNQFAHLYQLLPHDEKLQALVKAVINTEARYIHQFPYCGAFQPPPESGLAPTFNEYAYKVDIHPPVDNQTVFECKYELDSLAGFLKMAHRYYKYTSDDSFINDNFKAAMHSIMTLIEHESLPTWDDDFNVVSFYSFTGLPGSPSPSVKNDGVGEPRAGNGLVATHHRPSDDLCVYPYMTSDNAMLAVELENIAQVLEATGTMEHVATAAQERAKTIREAIWAHTITPSGIFAYETDGFGSISIMSDANVPDLVSLPYIGFLDRSDETYQRTKAAMFSRQNPYYGEGGGFKGFGGPHAGLAHPWPMSLVSGIYGTDDDEEIKGRLQMLLNSTAGLGLIHESVNIHDMSDFTRPWFAWANSYFAEMILDLAERKPHLIFADAQPYVPGTSWN